jgi:hypothetical protein
MQSSVQRTELNKWTDERPTVSLQDMKKAKMLYDMHHITALCVKNQKLIHLGPAIVQSYYEAALL